MTLPVPWNWPPIQQSSDASGPSFPFATPTDDPSAAGASWNLNAQKWTDPDIAANGWEIFPLPFGAALTRAGDINVRANPAVGTYFSSLKQGQLWVQLRSGAFGAFIGRSGAANGETYRMRARSQVIGLGAGNQFYMFGYVATGQGLETAPVNYVRIGQFDIHMEQHWFTGATFHPTAPNGDRDFSPAIADSDACYYIDVPTVPAVGAISSVGVSSFSGAWCAYYPSGNNVDLGVPITYAGIVFGMVGGTRPNLHYIDFIERQTLYQFP